MQSLKELFFKIEYACDLSELKLTKNSKSEAPINKLIAGWYVASAVTRSNDPSIRFLALVLILRLATNERLIANE